MFTVLKFKKGKRRHFPSETGLHVRGRKVEALSSQSVRTFSPVLMAFATAPRPLLCAPAQPRPLWLRAPPLEKVEFFCPRDPQPTRIPRLDPFSQPATAASLRPGKSFPQQRSLNSQDVSPSAPPATIPPRFVAPSLTGLGCYPGVYHQCLDSYAPPNHPVITTCTRSHALAPQPIVLPPPPQFFGSQTSCPEPTRRALRSASIGPVTSASFPTRRRASLPRNTAQSHGEKDTLLPPQPVRQTTRASLFGNLATRAKEMLGMTQKPVLLDAEENKEEKVTIQPNAQRSSSPMKDIISQRPAVPSVNRFTSAPVTLRLCSLSPLQRFTKMKLPASPEPADGVQSKRQMNCSSLVCPLTTQDSSFPKGYGCPYDVLISIKQEPQRASACLPAKKRSVATMLSLESLIQPPSSLKCDTQIHKQVVSRHPSRTCFFTDSDQGYAPPPTPPAHMCTESRTLRRVAAAASTTASSIELSDDMGADHSDFALKLRDVVAQLKGLAVRASQIDINDVDVAIESLERAIDKIEERIARSFKLSADVAENSVLSDVCRPVVLETEKKSLVKLQEDPWTLDSARIDSLTDPVVPDNELFTLSPDQSSAIPPSDITSSPQDNFLLPESSQSNNRKSMSSLEEQLETLTEKQLDFNSLWFLTMKDETQQVHASKFWELRNELEVIQCGGQGTVYGGVYKDTDVAIKIPTLEQLALPDYAESVLAKSVQEWFVLSQCDHPGIVRFVGALRVAKDEIWLVTERVYGPDLHTLKYRLACPIHPPLAVRMCAQLAQTLYYLHSGGAQGKCPIVHGDIKPENILIDTVDGRIQLCDFGDSTVLTGSDVPKRRGVTWLYAPFEVLNATPSHDARTYPPPTEKSDIWAAGCVFHEILGGLNPFRNVIQDDSPHMIQHALQSAAAQGRLVPQILDIMPPGVQRLIRECLSPDPADRPTAQEVSSLGDAKCLVCVLAGSVLERSNFKI